MAALRMSCPVPLLVNPPVCITPEYVVSALLLMLCVYEPERLMLPENVMS